MTELTKDSEQLPPFETADLRANLATYLNTPFDDPSGIQVRSATTNGAFTPSSIMMVSRSMSARQTRCFELGFGDT